MCRRTIPRSKVIGEDLCAHSVDASCEIAVGNGCIASFNTPKGLTESPHCGRWVEDNFSTVHAKCLPIHRMVATIADVDSNFGIHSVKYWMSSVSFHVIRRFIEVPYSGNMVLQQTPDST